MANLKITPAQEKAVKSEGFLRNRGTDNFSARIITVNGKITAAQQKLIGDAAEKFKVAVGGCPNNCVKPDLNDLGIVGQMVPNYDKDLCMGCKKCAVEDTCPMGAAKVVDGILEMSDECNNCGKCIGKCNFDAIPDGERGYKIFIGGMWGKRPQVAKPLSKIFKSPKEVYDVIEKMLLLYREQGQTRERVAQTVNRIGFENVEAQLLSDEIMERKDKILNADLH